MFISSLFHRKMQVCFSEFPSLFSPRFTTADLIDAVNKVVKGYKKFSATPKYMVYN